MLKTVELQVYRHSPDAFRGDTCLRTSTILSTVTGGRADEQRKDRDNVLYTSNIRPGDGLSYMQ